MQLRYTRMALNDLSNVLDYISERSPKGAVKVKSRIKAVTELLIRYPLIGTPTDDPTIRRIAATPYPFLIFYEPTQSAIIVHAVRHAAQDPSKAPGGSV